MGENFEANKMRTQMSYFKLFIFISAGIWFPWTLVINTIISWKPSIRKMRISELMFIHETVSDTPPFSELHILSTTAVPQISYHIFNNVYNILKILISNNYLFSIYNVSHLLWYSKRSYTKYKQVKTLSIIHTKFLYIPCWVLCFNIYLVIKKIQRLFLHSCCAAWKKRTFLLQGWPTFD